MVSFSRTSRSKVFSDKSVLKNFAKFTRKHLCWSLKKKNTPTQVFSCEFCEIFKNTSFYRTPPMAASVSGEKRTPTLIPVYLLTENECL